MIETYFNELHIAGRVVGQPTYNTYEKNGRETTVWSARLMFKGALAPNGQFVTIRAFNKDADALYTEIRKDSELECRGELRFNEYQNAQGATIREHTVIIDAKRVVNLTTPEVENEELGQLKITAHPEGATDARTQLALKMIENVSDAQIERFKKGKEIRVIPKKETQNA